MSQHHENDETQQNSQPHQHPHHTNNSYDDDTDDDSYEYENIFQDPMVDKVRDELNQRIKFFEEDLKQLEFVLVMIKERRKKYKDIIFTKTDEDIVKNSCVETQEKLDAAKKRLSDFESLMETKVKALEFAINQRWVDLQYIEKSTEGLFERLPKLKDHFYDTQEQMEKEADGILSALHGYIKQITISDDHKKHSSHASHTNHSKPSTPSSPSSPKRFSPARMNSLLEDMIHDK